MVITTSWIRATMAPTDIFHSRKYAQMNSTTRIMKTPRPSRARSATWAPQLAPTSWVEMSFLASTPTVSAITLATSVAWSLVSSSVWTRMESVPEVFTIGDEAASMPVPATALRISSAFLLGDLVGGKADGVLHAALELDAEVQTLDEEPADGQGQDHRGDAVPEPLAAHEVDRYVALVERVAEPARLAHQTLPATSVCLGLSSMPRVSRDRPENRVPVLKNL